MIPRPNTELNATLVGFTTLVVRKGRELNNSVMEALEASVLTFVLQKKRSQSKEFNFLKVQFFLFLFLHFDVVACFIIFGRN